jgi:RimJ/RimL family protein N-acetyltransferase
MTEAATSIVDWAIAQPQIFRVWAFCDVENAASARVLEKLGMKYEGILRRWLAHTNISADPRDCLCYAKVK